MANNIIEFEDLDFSNGSNSSEEEQEEVEIFDENRKSISLEANTRKIISKVPLLIRRGKRDNKRIFKAGPNI